MSDLNRAFSYDQNGTPAMVIYKNTPRAKTFRLKINKVEGYVIPLNDAYLFSRDHYPMLCPVFYGYDSSGNALTDEKVLTYDQAMYAKCEELCIQFDLGLVTSQKMAAIATLIEDGITELIGMPPQKTETKSIGEIKTIMSKKDGKTETMSELTEEIPA